MKILQTIIIALFVTSFLTLTGCDTDGQIELKEPRMELEDMPKRKDWLTTPVTQQPEEATEE